MFGDNSISGYQGQSGAIETKYGDGKGFVKVYNNTGGAITEGKVYALGITVVSSKITPVPITPATETTTSNYIIVYNPALNGDVSLADATWGWFQFYGECEANVDGTGDVAAGDQLEVITDGTAFISAGIASGAVFESNCAAIALDARTTNSVGLATVFLLGKPSAIAAS